MNPNPLPPLSPDLNATVLWAKVKKLLAEEREVVALFGDKLALYDRLRRCRRSLRYASAAYMRASDREAVKAPFQPATLAKAYVPVTRRDIDALQRVPVLNIHDNRGKPRKGPLSNTADRVLTFLEGHPDSISTLIQRGLDMSQPTADTALKELYNRGLVVRTGAPRRYTVKLPPTPEVAPEPEPRVAHSDETHPNLVRAIEREDDRAAVAEDEKFGA